MHFRILTGWDGAAEFVVLKLKILIHFRQLAKFYGTSVVDGLIECTSKSLEGVMRVS